MFSVANGHQYCTALLKATCCFSQLLPSSDHSSSGDSSPSLVHPHSLTGHSSPSHYQPPFTSTPASAPTLLGHERQALKTTAEVTPDSSTRNEDVNQTSRNNRPPQSQGIPIAGARFSRRRSSGKRGSMASSGAGSFNPFGTSEGKFGSFMRSGTIFNSSYGSSANSWSIWNASSLEAGSHVPPGSSFRSWFWVDKPEGSDQSGEGQCVEGVVV